MKITDLPKEEDLLKLVTAVTVQARDASGNPRVLLDRIDDFNALLGFQRSVNGPAFTEAMNTLRGTCSNSLIDYAESTVKKSAKARDKEATKTTEQAPVQTTVQTTPQEPVTKPLPFVEGDVTDKWQCKKCKVVHDEYPEVCPTPKCGGTAFSVYKGSSAELAQDLQADVDDSGRAIVIVSEEIASCDNPDCQADKLVAHLPPVTKLPETRIDYACTVCAHRGTFMATPDELAAYRATGVKVQNFDVQKNDPKTLFSRPPDQKPNASVPAPATTPKKRGRTSGAKSQNTAPQASADAEGAPPAATVSASLPVPGAQPEQKANINVAALVDRVLAGSHAPAPDSNAVYDAVLVSTKQWPDERVTTEYLKLYGDGVALGTREYMAKAIARRTAGLVDDGVAIPESVVPSTVPGVPSRGTAPEPTSPVPVAEFRL